MSAKISGRVIRLGVALIVVLVTGPASVAEAGGAFRAACVKVDITPSAPQWLQGYGPRKSTGVHDRIYHRILAMDDGTTQFFLVSTDVCTILPSFYDEFSQELERDTGIKPEHIWWATTHTHSAPHVGPQDLGRLFGGTLGDRLSIKHDVAYWDRVKRDLIRGPRIWLPFRSLASGIRQENPPAPYRSGKAPDHPTARREEGQQTVLQGVPGLAEDHQGQDALADGFSNRRQDHRLCMIEKAAA